MSGPHLKHYIPATSTPKPGFDAATHIKISVYYSKGGTNYFTYKEEPSAIWAGISPVTRKGGIESFILGKGLKISLEPATRLNRKHVEAAFERAVAEVTMGTGRVWDALQRVLAEEGVTLLSDVPSTEAAKA
jgi:hypothetical protein